MKALKFIIYIGVFLFVSSLAVVGYLGGYSEVEIVQKQGSIYTIYGKWYKGSAQNKAWGDFFNQQEAKVKAGNTGAAVVAYYANEPNKENKYYTEAFVGTTERALLKGQDSIVIGFSASLYGSKNAHHMVTRLPLNLFQYAQENGDSLDMSRMIEFYLAEDKMALEIPMAN